MNAKNLFRFEGRWMGLHMFELLLLAAGLSFLVGRVSAQPHPRPTAVEITSSTAAPAPWAQGGFRDDEKAGRSPDWNN